MLPIGLSSTRKKVLSPELFRAYHEAGITHMEICPQREEYDSLDFAAISRWAKETDTTLWSFHLPFSHPDDLDISSVNEDLRKKTLQYHFGFLEKAAAIGVKTFVIHPSSEPVGDETRKQQLENSKDSLRQLVNFGDRLGVTVAVEDLPRSCLGHNTEEIAELLTAHEHLRVCFDVNHLLLDSHEKFLHAVGNKIATVHISDYDYVDERHWLPGEGKTDWNKLYHGLLEVGYQGPWLYEIGFDCPATLTRSRPLTCEDFARNAKEIFGGKPLTVVK